MGAPGEGPALLLQGRHSRVALKPSGIPHCEQKKKQENHQKTFHLQQSINSPKCFKAHFQSTPNPTPVPRGPLLLLSVTAASGNRLPGGQKFSCCWLGTAQGAQREGMKQPGEMVGEGKSRGMMHPATARQAVL